MSEDAKAQRRNDEEATRRRATLLGQRYFDSRTLTKHQLYEGMLTNEEMYNKHVIVLSVEKGSLIAAITPRSPQTIFAELPKKFEDHRVSFVMISESGFREYMQLYDPPEEINYDNIEINDDDRTETIASISETLETVRPDDILDYLITQSYKLTASDIHIEVEEEHVRMRFRVDGVLHDVAKLSYEKNRQFMGAIASRANISTSAPKPQTGHMKYDHEEDGERIQLNMRIETVPTLYGQDAVIRLFNFDTSLLKLKNLGLNTEQSKLIEDIVESPHGLVLVSGPTGSGKTTTLYSILSALNTPQRKIITLEDPVEYSLPGIVQIPVNTGKDESFADKLRAVLRLDPDVIMIGEIRDADTAVTALQAALSGHLVLSTFHANDASTAVSRLIETAGHNPLYASAIRLVIAQRLLRKLHQPSKQGYAPSESELKMLAQAGRKSVSELYRPGKADDSPFGYDGQTIVLELLEMSNDMQEEIRNSTEAVAAETVAALAKKAGMKTMHENAANLVADGITDLGEMLRVIS